MLEGDIVMAEIPEALNAERIKVVDNGFGRGVRHTQDRHDRFVFGAERTEIAVGKHRQSGERLPDNLLTAVKNAD